MEQFKGQSASRFSFQVNLDTNSIVPVYTQIANAYRTAILGGQLQDDDLLPSLNELAELLGVSRSTVARAFEALASQGYIKIHARSGAKVCRRYLGDLEPRPVHSNYQQGDHVHLSGYGRRLLKLSSESVYSDSPELQTYMSGPALELTPLKHWKTLLEQNCRMRDLSRLEYSQEPFGYPPLREAYAAYLKRSRAVKCSAEQVVVFSARELRLDLICRMLINPGDCVVVEDPGYPDVRQRFELYGAKVIAMPTDRDGLCVDQLEQLEEKIKVLYVSPSYVDPTGAILSMPRRLQLLEWAKRTRTFIVEDDYASEYRYKARPLPSLQGLDHGDVVIHLSCLWKVLYPVLRLGFLVVPRSLREIFTLAKGLTENDLPLFDQFALTDFINDGSLERHIRRTRSIYAKRRDALVESLKSSLEDKVTVLNDAAGFELLIRLKTTLKEQEVLTLARLHRLPLFSSQPHYVSQHSSGEFIIPFAELEDDSLADYVAKLRALLS
ncbi:MAG: PLP-dependent aminotransferase family protein [Candidatus Obscuribacterales bacterium]